MCRALWGPSATPTLAHPHLSSGMGVTGIGIPPSALPLLLVVLAPVMETAPPCMLSTPPARPPTHTRCRHERDGDVPPRQGVQVHH